MGLDIPELDERTFEDYFEQAKKLIPVYAEEWTDRNVHDPGITILEVLAWLTETHTYQLDQITDKHREKYLQLVGHQRQLQQSASTRVSLSPPSEAAGQRLPIGTRLVATDKTNDTYRFETVHDVVLTDASLDRVLTMDASGRTDNSQENAGDGMFYRAFGKPVKAGDALYLGFDSDPFEIARALTLVVEYHDDDLPDPTPVGDDDPEFVPSVELQWEYLPPDSDSWVPLDVRRDGTTSFYNSGRIELACPAEPQSKQERRRGQERGQEREEPSVQDGLSDAFVWVRCRVETPGYEIPPQLTAIEPNVVTVKHRMTVTDEKVEQSASLGDPTALNSQTYELENEDILTVDVRVDGDSFVEVHDFDASRPDDQHYIINRTNGEITFGDGKNGCSLPDDATVTADYVYGGGKEGNISEDVIWQFENPTVSLTNHTMLSDIGLTAKGGATGGTDRETIDEALKRARRDLRTSYRGVTTDDYEQIAKQTPGLRIGRTNAFVKDGEITVVVVPYAPADTPNPKPSEGFLRTVRRYVSERSLLSDQLNVTGPTYAGLEVTVSGRARPRFTDGGHETAVRTAIESYVHPLVGYDGNGWPFGQTLQASDLVDQITNLEEINYISDISITAHGGKNIDDRTVTISDQALFAVEEVTTDMTVPAPERSSGGI